MRPLDKKAVEHYDIFKLYAKNTRSFTEGGNFTLEQGSSLTEGGVDVTTTETERLIRWLVQHGHTYEEAYECIAFMSGRTEKPEKKE